MNKYLIIIAGLLLFACSNLPKSDGDAIGLSITKLGGLPAAVFENRNDLTIVYGNEKSGKIWIFSQGQWSPDEPDFNFPTQRDPRYKDKLIVRLNRGDHIVFKQLSTSSTSKSSTSKSDSKPDSKPDPESDSKPHSDPEVDCDPDSKLVPEAECDSNSHSGSDIISSIIILNFKNVCSSGSGCGPEFDRPDFDRPDFDQELIEALQQFDSLLKY